MSDDKNQSDDDGWGEAAEREAQEAPKPSPEEKEWDATDLDSKVAALKPSSEVASPTTPAAAPIPPTDMATATTGDTATPESHTEDADLGSITSRMAASVVRDEEVAQEVAAEDAPQWVPVDSQEEPFVPEEPEEEVAPKKKSKRDRARKALDSLPMSRRRRAIFVGSGLVLIVAVVCTVLGYFNQKHFYLVCGEDEIRAEQGSFWPWGQTRLSGKAFVPIAIARDVRCQDRQFEGRGALEATFLGALLEQSSQRLSKGDSKEVDEAEKLLEQALLLSRSAERSEERKLALRLQGDVSYWRGAAQVQEAAAVLRRSAEQFKAAAAKRPRHANDASAWAQHAEFISEEIDKGPRELREDDAPKSAPTFQGLGVGPTPSTPPAAQETGTGEGETATGESAKPVDAAKATPAAEDETPEPLPRGGVLL